MEGSDRLEPAPTSGLAAIATPRALMAVACAAASAAILVAKFALAARININWDEFYFLSHVYALARGELDLFLQGAYTHAFLWITATGGNEVDQIVRLRLAMCVLLAISAALVYALARLRASPAAASVAVLSLLASWPMLKHGASFRADSMLLPLLLAAFYFALRSAGHRRRDAVIAGACFGVAFVVTVKAVLLLPALVAMVALPDVRHGRASANGLSVAWRHVATVLVAAATVAAILLTLHHGQVVKAAEPAGAFASRALSATVFEMQFIPRRELAVQLAALDPAYWLAAFAGLVVSLRRRDFGTAAAALCFAPLLFYRNAFPYFFPVLMAPAAVLVAVAVDWLLGIKAAPGRAAAIATVAIGCIALLHGAWDGVARLRFDETAGERATVAAVHRVFPQAVPYIDHSGMIASFPKVNFFMSTWGIERYLSLGADFMPEALRGRCPPLLLVNHSVLSPGALLFRQLRPVDREMLESSYLRYWGPIRVAGAAVRMRDGDQASVRVPCSGAYRATSARPLLVDGHAVGDGEVVELTGGRSYHLDSGDPTSPPWEVTFVWAGAKEPPADPPPRMPLYSPL